MFGHTTTIGEMRLAHSLHLQFTPQIGACGKPLVVPHNRRPQARTDGKWEERSRAIVVELRVAWGCRRMVGPAVQLPALVADGCDALVATRVMPTAVWRMTT